MKPLRDPAQTLNEGICGFRQYVLSEPLRLAFASRSLCGFLGQRELSAKRYAEAIDPEDREKYAAFLRKLCRAGGRRSISYRLMSGTGKLYSVRDTFTVSTLEDGTRIAEAVLSQQPDPTVWQDDMPCGYLRFTCEKQPKIRKINLPMRQILHLSVPKEGEADDLELYRENIFLMLPMQERRRFARYLELIRTEGTPITGEISLLCADGSRAHVFGWITLREDRAGNPEFQVVCMDVTGRHRKQKDQETRRYLRALTDVYEKIFSYDRTDGTVKCIHDSRASRFRLIQDIPMQMEEATSRWIADTVVPEEQEKVRRFFHDSCEIPSARPDSRPPRITYRAVCGTGEVRLYQGIVLTVSDSVSLYCCRRKPEENAALKLENVALKENMQELIQRFTDGIAAFELRGNTVTPLYVTENICKFFGKTREEWLPLMEKATPIPEFVAQSSVDFRQFEHLLETGEAEFSYFNVETGTVEKMKAICSHKSPTPGASRYVMLYNVEEQNGPAGVQIRTFGYFDVFVGESPIAFRNAKSKELLALLVDRQGGFVTSEEAIACLWEDEPVNPVTLARYRKVALRLKNLLTEYGISDIVENVDGKRRIVPSKVRCDLYDYLTGEEKYASLFKGSYLSNYSWGETTLAELTGDLLE